MPTDVRFKSQMTRFHQQKCDWSLEPDSYGSGLHDFESLIGNHPVPQYPCRRVSSFPCLNTLASLGESNSMRARSLSESANLDAVWVSMFQVTLDDIKRELAQRIPVSKSDQRLLRSGSKSEAPDELSNPDSEFDENETLRKRSDTWPKLKKIVSFADDRGLPLHTVHQMLEPSDMPPSLSASMLRALQNLTGLDDDMKPKSTWELSFKQPASEYMKFRNKVEQNFVALENAIVRNDTIKLHGTIRVKNVAFEKKVFIRFTDNKWSSYVDKDAVYTTGVPGDVHETFRFEIDIPFDDDSHQRIDFCIGFIAGGEGGVTYWDNNNGENYTLVSERQKVVKYTPKLPEPRPDQVQPKNRLPYDAYTLDTHNWGSFSSWHMVEESPYY